MANLWFEKRFKQNADQDHLPCKLGLKKLIWSLYSQRARQETDGQLDICTMLLYLSCDGDELKGTEKAFATITGTTSRRAAISAENIHQLMYPMGRQQPDPDKFCQYTINDVKKIVDKVLQAHQHDGGAAATLTFDEVMFSSGASAIAKRLRAKYKLKDIYIECEKEASERGDTRDSASTPQLL